MIQEIVNTIEEFCHPGIEKSVLSCLIKNPNLLISSDKEITYDHFLSPLAREMFVCLESLYTKQVDTYNADVIHNEAKNLKSLKYLNTQDGYEYIRVVLDAEIKLELFSYYATELIDRADKFNLHEYFDKSKKLVRSNIENVKNSLSIEDLVSKVESDLYTLTTANRQSQEAVSFSDYIYEYLEKIKQPPIDILGVRSGFRGLDKLLNGFKDGGLYIVAARAKQGKSTVLLEWAKHISYLEKHPVLYIDTEMNKELMMTRLMAQLTGISIADLENHSYSRDPMTLENIELAGELIMGGSFKYKSMPRFTPELLRYEIKKFYKQNGHCVVVFDYIKLPDGLDLKVASETQQLGYLTTGLKSLGNELSIPIISAVQFNRDGVGRDPQSHFISGSDRILHYADCLMAIRKLNDKERAYYRSQVGSFDSIINGIITIMDSRSTSSNSSVLLEMDLERASIREASEQSFGTDSEQAAGL